MIPEKPRRKPYLLQFEQTGDADGGFLVSTQRAASIPFEVRRVFWTYGTPPEKQRGGHANFETEEVMVAVQGQVEVKTETLAGEQKTFVLNNAAEGLVIPAYCWLSIKFEPETILVCLASTDYDENKYIRDLTAFRNLRTV